MPRICNRRLLSLVLSLVLSVAVLGLSAPVLAGETAYAVPDEGPRGARSAPSALSTADRLTYTTAFDALRRGDLEAARASARQAQDRILLGRVEFERLFHRDHIATYDELTAWLEDYADLPEAPRAYNLALRRRPDGAPEPRRPASVGGRIWNSLTPGGSGGVDDPRKAARVALNADDLNGAWTLGQQIGDWWTAGLAAWRLGRYADAHAAFERVEVDPTEDPWVRAGGAYWAARAAREADLEARVEGHLRYAARWPATFYGQLALRRLGEEPLIENLGPRPYAAAYAATGAEDAPGVDDQELAEFVRNDPDARRTVAFYEVGRRQDAQDGLRAGLRGAVDDAARRLWIGLARVLGPRIAGRQDAAARINAEHYPLPELTPEGGFTIERALVYAIARKETDFNAEARSSAGAYGMMQVMPGTAAEMTGDPGFVREPQRLLQPAVNLRLGQAYVMRMLQLPAFEGDLLRAVASYNSGPGPMLAALRRLGPDADGLLLIESIDVPQARDYVEKVVAAYWIYQRLLGGPLNTLDAAASGARHVPVALDYVPPPPAAPVEVATAAPAEGVS